MQAQRLLGAGAVLLAVLLGGCKMVTQEELAQIRSAGQRVGPDPQALLTQKIVPYAQQKATPAGEVLGAARENFDSACQKYGFHHSAAFPCNFWVVVQGQVKEMKTTSRNGKAVIEAQAADGKPVRVSLQIGPVIVGNGVRDGSPDIKYADFDDQTRFAEFGRELNKLIVEQMGDAKALKPGDAVDVVGVYSSWSEPGDEVLVVPVVWK